jgi:hypothetical protein
VPRGTAHAWAALGQLREAELRLEEQVEPIAPRRALAWLLAVGCGVGLVRIWSASLVQRGGWQRWCRPSPNRATAAVSSWTLATPPRRRAWRPMVATDTSTRLGQDPEVGVKGRWTRGRASSQAWTRWWLWVAELTTTGNGRRG